MEQVRLVMVIRWLVDMFMSSWYACRLISDGWLVYILEQLILAWCDWQWHDIWSSLGSWKLVDSFVYYCSLFCENKIFFTLKYKIFQRLRTNEVGGNFVNLDFCLTLLDPGGGTNSYCNCCFFFLVGNVFFIIWLLSFRG